MRRHLRLSGALAAALLATACTVYKYKDLDGAALAKSKKGTILQVQTADDTVGFSPSDPPVVKDGAVVGGIHMTYSVDPQDIVELSPEKKAARLVLKDGTRFLVTASGADGERILCEAVKPVSIPLDEIVRAQVRTVNTGASVFNTFAGVLLAWPSTSLSTPKTANSTRPIRSRSISSFPFSNPPRDTSPRARDGGPTRPSWE
jgi:hypothetical protein